MNGLLLSNHLTSVRFSWVDPCPPLMDGQQCFRHKRKQHKPISSSSWRRPEPVNPTSASLTVLFNTNEICYVGIINKIIYVELLLFLFGQSAKVQSVHSATVVKTNVSGQSHCSSNWLTNLSQVDKNKTTRRSGIFVAVNVNLIFLFSTSIKGGAKYSIAQR